uniref:(northern house mosquito) hypothetical protein n=1 Tax=Culex pipiens TaxID=7175 RepID=A0A8D8BX21_CULPI
MQIWLHDFQRKCNKNCHQDFMPSLKLFRPFAYRIDNQIFCSIRETLCKTNHANLTRKNMYFSIADDVPTLFSRKFIHPTKQHCLILWGLASSSKVAKNDLEHHSLR